MTYVEQDKNMEHLVGINLVFNTGNLSATSDIFVKGAADKAPHYSEFIPPSNGR
jgi:hypothetical protein